MKALLPTLFLAALALSASCKNKALTKIADPRLSDIRLPPGFRISLFADSVPNARSLALGAKGTVFVGNRSGDKVYALVDENKDGVADTMHTLAAGLNTPNGVAFHNGALYVAEISKVWRMDSIESRLTNVPKPVPVLDGLPTDEHHGWKYIAFGPDGKLYIPIGAPCNVCDKRTEDPRYATICCVNPDGKNFRIVAHGIRNSVGFDWQPGTSELWFTENGRDRLGDNTPPDELNHAPREGMDFGFPYCHAGDVLDPEFGKGHTCAEFTAPAQKLAPHAAALGMKFYSGAMFPAQYKGNVLIAEHGSWNRSEPIGYRVMMVTMKDGKPTGYAPFAEGWLKNGKAWGRPVDVLQMPDGSVLVSDDQANCVYRISYEG